ncbi:MAG: phospholipid carrier-dependent glycosyltransferase [Candidatus Limnocylindria bacterium]
MPEEIRIIDRPIDRTRVAWTRSDTIALVVIVISAAAMRMVSLGRPIELVFDEIFYARDACWYVIGTEGVCGISELASRSHPPLGKWLIGSGIVAFGYEPFGWRVAVAVAGIVSVALLYVLAWRLLRGVVAGHGATVGAIAASGLLATDFLHLVHSRVAMLDAFIALFVVGAATFAVLDRDRVRERTGAPWWWRLTLGRPWRLLAGVCLGAATATKWSGAYVAPAVIGLVIAWEIAEQRRQNPGAGWWLVISAAVRREALPTLVLLGVVPLIAYLASYTGRMPGVILALPWEVGSVWRGIWDHQRAMLDFHTTLGGDHPYQSPSWSWPLLRRPVAYWFSDEGGVFREILALGNPLLWWPGIFAVVGLGVTWWRSGWGFHRPEPVILTSAAATYLPWLVLSGDRSQTFLWYFLPTVPFLALAIGLLAATAWATTRGRVAAGVYGLVIVASFAFYLPLLTALPLAPDGWRARILFADCDRDDRTAPSLPDDSTSQGVPPDGWCWI